MERTTYVYPECHFGDHDYRKSPTCARCGKRLRCYMCGHFVPMNGRCGCFEEVNSAVCNGTGYVDGPSDD